MKFKLQVVGRFARRIEAANVGLLLTPNPTYDTIFKKNIAHEN